MVGNFFLAKIPTSSTKQSGTTIRHTFKIFHRQRDYTWAALIFLEMGKGNMQFQSASTILRNSNGRMFFSTIERINGYVS